MSDIDIGQFGEALNRKTDLDFVNSNSNLDYIIESYRNGTEFYYLYRSGWLIQGGKILTTADSTVTINILKKYIDYQYNVHKTNITSSSGTSSARYQAVFSRTDSSFNVYQTANTVSNWIAFGMVG